MSTNELELIWNSQLESDSHQHSLTLDEIRSMTLKFSSDNISASRRMIIFDSIYKGIVLAGYLVLVSIGILTPAKLVFTLLILTSLAYLVFRNRTIDNRLNTINETDPVIMVQQKRYDSLLGFHREFLFSTSITHPLFVLAGFQFYHFFKYGEDGFYTLISDPVIYVFLILAFFIPFIAQKLTYAKIIGDMEEILDLEIEEVEQELSVINMQARRRSRVVIFAVLSLIGIAILITLLIHLV